MFEKIVDTAYLVVADDGTDVFYRERPNGPSLVVDVVRSRGRYWQQTYTRLIYRATDIQALDPIIVRPRGVNWEAERIDRPLVVWRRPHVKKAWPFAERQVITAPRREIV
jgi:hypothetical protein